MIISRTTTKNYPLKVKEMKSYSNRLVLLKQYKKKKGCRIKSNCQIPNFADVPERILVTSKGFLKKTNFSKNWEV